MMTIIEQLLPFSGSNSGSQSNNQSGDQDSKQRSAQRNDRHHSGADGYDLRLIEERCAALKQAAAHHDVRERVFVIEEGLHGNLGGIGSWQRYQKANAKTRALIREYLHGTAQTLRDLAKTRSPHWGAQQKKDLFTRASQCYGCSALMLSGAGSLTPWHLGVAATLQQADLLPRVISGSSGGAVVAAMLGTRSVAQRKKLLSEKGLQNIVSQLMQAFALDNTDEEEEAVPIMLWGIKKFLPKAMPVSILQHFIEHSIEDLTFGEALERSGLDINISVTPSDIKGSPRLMNAITTPHVFVRDAVMASCAVPGFFPPVRLYARSYDNQRRPYMADTTWIDGSVGMEMPSRRLARLYGVNHFIASQTNLLVLWALQQSQQAEQAGTLGRTLFSWAGEMAHANLKALQPFTNLLTKPLPGLNSAQSLFYSVAGQDYLADINIMPERQIVNVVEALSPISAETANELITHGQERTAPLLEFIDNCTLISRTLDEING